MFVFVRKGVGKRARELSERVRQVAMETTVEDVVIVGAGIAGLATAVALKSAGIEALVLERSEGLRATGAALIDSIPQRLSYSSSSTTALVLVFCYCIRRRLILLLHSYSSSSATAFVIAYSCYCTSLMLLLHSLQSCSSNFATALVFVFCYCACYTPENT
ncbi:putative FAD/NAD(P)-binding domain-containing protein [Rosa chinensis]|uniref:Putative FAD/NAD(P)-binding domain-containing protein n=1 Tax=Rosa chinensis TaxID=74649 RepID=A0A2P6RS23_ROSCH|nr:putative FAD/NAD(P)-binding domain-containing protein [Rosa chinensis]